MGRCQYSLPGVQNSIATIASTGIVKTTSLDPAAVTKMDEADDTGGFAPWWRIVSLHLAATLPPSAFPFLRR